MDFFLKLLSCQDKTVKYWYEKSESETTHLKVKSLQQNSPPGRMSPLIFACVSFCWRRFAAFSPSFLGVRLRDVSPVEEGGDTTTADTVSLSCCCLM